MISRSVVLDSNQDIIMAMQSASSTLTFVDNLSSKTISTGIIGSAVGIVAKFLSNGTMRWWARYDGTGGEYPYSCAVDSARNIYVVGHSDSPTLTVYHASGAAFSPATPARSGNHAYLLKWSPLGVFQWWLSLDGSAGEGIADIVIDSMDRIHMIFNTGSPSVTVLSSFGRTFLLPTGGECLKLDTNGSLIWYTNSVGGIVLSVRVDSQSNVYLGGSYTAPMIFYNSDGNQVYTLTAAGTVSSDGFAAVYSSNGSFIAAMKYGGGVYQYMGVTVPDIKRNVLFGNFYSNAIMNLFDSSMNYLTNVPTGTNEVGFMFKVKSLNGTFAPSSPVLVGSNQMSYSFGAAVREIAVAGTSIFVAGSNSGNGIYMKQYDTFDGSLYRSFSGHTGDISSLFILNDMLFTGSWDQSSIQWSVSNGSIVRRFTGHTGQVNAVCADSTYFYSASSDGTVRQYTLATGLYYKNYTRIAPVWSIAVSGNALIVGTANGSLVSYNPNLAANVIAPVTVTYLGHTQGIRALFITGTKLYTASDDGTSRVYTIGTGTSTQVFRGHTGSVNSVFAYTDYQSMVLTASNDGFVKQWLESSGSLIYNYTNANSPLTTLAYSNNWIFAGSLNGTIRQFKHRYYVNQLASGGTYVRQILFFNNSLLIAGEDSRIRRWDFQTNSITRTYCCHSFGGVYAIAVNGNQLFSTGADTTLRVWDISTGVQANSVTMVGAIWGSFITIHQGNVFVSCADNTIRRYTFGLTLVQTYPFETNSMVPYNNTLVLVSLSTLTVRFVDVSNWRTVKQYYWPTLASAGFKINGDFLYSGGASGLIQEFSLVTGHSTKNFTGHTNTIRELSFFGDYMYSSSHDMVLRKWRISTGESLFALTGAHAIGMTNSLVGGGFLFTGSDDGIVKSWNLDFDSLVISAPNLLTSSSTSSTPSVTRTAAASLNIAIATPPSQPPPTSSDTTSLTNITPASTSSSSIWLILVIIAVVLFVSILILYFVFRSRKSKKHTAVVNTNAETVQTTEFTAESNNQTSITSQKVEYDINATTTWIEGGATTMMETSNEIAIPAYLCKSKDTHFKIGDFITKGGGGEIFHCEATDPDILSRSGSNALVVKVVGDDVDSMKPKMRDAFYQEISLMWRMRDHRNFVKLYAYSTTAPATIIMKFYQHDTLSAYVHGKSKALYEDFQYAKISIVDIFKQICDGIKYFHAYGFVHLDLKPANILMDVTRQRQLIPIITDFGISRIVSDENLKVGAFKTSELKGASIAYAAPEVLVNFRKSYSSVLDPEVIKAGDIYALGIILYEMSERVKPWRQQ